MSLKFGVLWPFRNPSFARVPWEIARPAPSATRRNESSFRGRVRLRQLVVGPSRRPASRNSGRASSSMEIRLGRFIKSIHSLSGESRTDGVGGASTISRKGGGPLPEGR